MQAMEIELEEFDEDERLHQLIIEEKAKSLKEWRNEFKVPGSLQTLAMRRIAKSCEYFTSQAENPLSHLPNSIVQQFLRLIVDARKKKISPLVQGNQYLMEKQLVPLLLNASVTEFACDDFEVVSLDQLCDNCPKICSISKTLSWFNRRLPLEKMNRWKNLQFISFKTCECTDESVKLMAQCMPQIRGLEFMIDPKDFSKNSGEHFSKMQNLSYLSITSHESFVGDFQTLMVPIVGGIPNLQSLELEDDSSYSNKFVQLFGELYPNKKLTMKKIWLDENFEVKWPSCLSTERLSLSTISSSAVVDDLCSFPFPLKGLTVISMPASIIYQLVDKFGHMVTDLRITYLEATSNLCAETLNLCRVLVACPQVETIYLRAAENCFEIGDLSPLNFKNCKKFDDQLIGANGELFKMFLIGSENYERELELYDHQLGSALEALIDNPISLDKLEGVVFRLFNCDHRLQGVLVIALLMISRSPYLKSLEFNHTQYSRKAYLKLLHRDYKWLMEMAEIIGIDINSYNSDDSDDDDDDATSEDENLDSDIEGDSDSSTD